MTINHPEITFHEAVIRADLLEIEGTLVRHFEVNDTVDNNDIALSFDIAKDDGNIYRYKFKKSDLQTASYLPESQIWQCADCDADICSIKALTTKVISING